MRRQQARIVRRTVLVAGLLIFGIWTVLPMYWIVVTAIKPDLLIYREPQLVPSQVTGDHFAFVLTKTPFLVYIKNSVLVTLVTTSLAMAIGTLAAYAIVRLSFRGRQWLARAVVVTYLVPGSLLFIPMFQVVYSIGLIDNIVGLMVTYLTFTVPFATWMMIGYFRNVPSELEDAALVDGCSRVQALARIMVPIALPALAVVALFAFTLSWNEFLYALVITNSLSTRTVTVGLTQMLGEDVFYWGKMMAGALITAVPPVIMYMLAQRLVIKGLVVGGVKG